jgi:hypothetical protein
VPIRTGKQVATAASAVALAGSAAGLAAAAGIGPFAKAADLQHTIAAPVVTTVLHADRLYPPVSPPPRITQKIIVTDPAPAAPVAPAATAPWLTAPTTAPTHVTSTPAATPAPRVSSTPSPCSDDCGGGGDS